MGRPRLQLDLGGFQLDVFGLLFLIPLPFLLNLPSFVGPRFKDLLHCLKLDLMMKGEKILLSIVVDSVVSFWISGEVLNSVLFASLNC